MTDLYFVFNFLLELTLGALSIANSSFPSVPKPNIPIGLEELPEILNGVSLAIIIGLLPL